MKPGLLKAGVKPVNIASKLRVTPSSGFPAHLDSAMAADWPEGGEASPVVQLLDHDILEEAVGQEPAAPAPCPGRAQCILEHATIDDCFHRGGPCWPQHHRHWHALAWEEHPYACIRAQGSVETHPWPGSKGCFPACIHSSTVRPGAQQGHLTDLQVPPQACSAAHQCSLARVWQIWATALSELLTIGHSPPGCVAWRPLIVTQPANRVHLQWSLYEGSVAHLVFKVAYSVAHAA